jgi:O-antigen ligase
VQFGTESNFASSGGFGPNQVSAILGFGALSAFLASFDRNAGLSFRLIMLGMTLALVIQSAMTFSRGGLLVAGLSTATALWYLIRDRRARMRLLMAVIALSVAGVYVIVPTLDSFTGGALSKRFGNHELTGREDVVRDDLDVWIANPVLGVGPGMAKFHRVRTNHGGRPMAAHTEFSRLLAEHGLLGLSAMGVLLLMCIHAVRRATSPHTRAFAIAYVSWSMLFMFQSGTRIVAPSLSMGLAHALGRGGRRRASDEDDVPEWMETALLIQASVSARAQRVARVPRAGLASGAAIEGPR